MDEIRKTIKAAISDSKMCGLGYDSRIALSPFFLNYHIGSGAIRSWRFIYIDDSHVEFLNDKFNRLYEYYGRIVCSDMFDTPQDRTSKKVNFVAIKISFVTTDEKIFNTLHSKKIKPHGLYILLSAILLNPQGTAVISEKYLETPMKDFYNEEVKQTFRLVPES